VLTVLLRKCSLTWSTRYQKCH